MLITLRIVAAFLTLAGIYLAAALSSGPDQADAHLCVLLGRLSWFDGPCTPMLGRYLIDGVYAIATICLASLIIDGSIWLCRRNRRQKIKPKNDVVDSRVHTSTPIPMSAEERDVWLLDAIWRAYLREWKRPSVRYETAGVGLQTNQQIHDIAFKEFRQLAFDGKIPVWAKPRGSDLWISVPKEYWKDHAINYLTVLRGKPENVRAALQRTGRETDDWTEFMTSRTSIDRLFPTTVPERKSGLVLSVGESGPYAGWDTGARDLWKIKRVLKLKLENADSDNPSSISDIQVSVQSIEPYRDHLGPWSLKSGFSLAAGADVFIPLASLNELYPDSKRPNRYEESDSFWEMLVERDSPYAHNVPLPPKSEAQYVSIRATGVGSTVCNYRCKIWVDKSDGRLRVSEADGWPVDSIVLRNPEQTKRSL